jgi:hypothetical protein
MVVNSSSRHDGRPGFERTIPPVSVDTRDELHQRLLRDILVVLVSGAEQPAQRTVDDRAEPVMERGSSCCVSVFDCPHESTVGLLERRQSARDDAKLRRRDSECHDS